MAKPAYLKGIGMNDTVTITVSKWEEYNPRKDLKSMPWFRIAADIGYSPTLYKLPVEAKWLWIFILSTCAKNISETIEMEIDYLADYSDVSAENIRKYLTEFERRRLIILNPIESDRIRSSQIGVIFDDEESVPKKREEEKREEKREEKNRREENRASAPILLSSFVDKEILKAVSAEVQTSWILKYPSEKYLKLQFSEISTWLKAKRKRPMKKPMDVFVGEWLESNWGAFVSRAQKTNPVIEANASAKASFLLEELTRHGADSPAYNEHDIEVISRLGDLKKIRECTPTEKQKIHREIKEIYISIMNSS